jgi:Flp pilus assembly protein TadD
MSPDLARAETLLELHRPTEAEQVVRDHLAAHPDSADALNLLCRTLNEQRRHAEAEDAIRAALTVAPDDADHVLQLASTLSALGRQRSALEVAHRLLEMRPHDGWSHYILAEALLAGRRPQTHDAYRAAERACELIPWSADAHNLRGMCAANLGLRPQAEAAYLEALALDSQHAFAMNNLAALHLDGGKFKSAAKKFTAAAQNTPSERIIQHNLDVLVVKWAQWSFYVQLGVMLVLAVQLAADGPWWGRAFTGLAFVSALAWHTRRFNQTLPRGFTTGLPLIGRISWSAKRIVIVSWVCTVALLVMSFAPFEAAVAVGLATFALLKTVGFVVLVCWIVLAVGRLLRREPGDGRTWYRLRERGIRRRSKIMRMR